MSVGEQLIELVYDYDAKRKNLVKKFQTLELAVNKVRQTIL